MIRFNLPISLSVSMLVLTLGNILVELVVAGTTFYTQENWIRILVTFPGTSSHDIWDTSFSL